MKNKKISILIDNPDSWMVPYGKKLVKELNHLGYETSIHLNKDELKHGWCLFLLSCEKKFTNLNLFDFNIVVHASDLPKGKRWSPLSWQILEGKNIIPITLFVANEEIDSGDYYLKDQLIFKGDELIDELRHSLGEKINSMILKFINSTNKVKYKQNSKSSYFKKRNLAHSELDIDKTIREQFNLLRIVDNEKYPAFFYHKKSKYILKIFKKNV